MAAKTVSKSDALTGVVLSELDKLVACIIELESSADESRWNAARCYTVAIEDEGATQVALAKAVGKSRRHVQIMLALDKLPPGENANDFPDIDFNEAYQNCKIPVTPPKAKPATQVAPPAKPKPAAPKAPFIAPTDLAGVMATYSLSADAAREALRRRGITVPDDPAAPKSKPAAPLRLVPPVEPKAATKAVRAIIKQRAEAPKSAAKAELPLCECSFCPDLNCEGYCDGKCAERNPLLHKATVQDLVTELRLRLSAVTVDEINGLFPDDSGGHVINAEPYADGGLDVSMFLTASEWRP